MKTKQDSFLQRYYTERSFKFFKLPDRVPSITKMLIIFKEFVFLLKLYSTFLSVFYHQYNGSTSNTNDINSDYLIFNSMNSQLAIKYVTFALSFILNILMIIHVGRDIILDYLKHPFVENIPLQFLLKAYNYSTFPLTLYTSFSLITSQYYALMIVNVFIAQIISLFVAQQDYDYCYYIQDYLARRYSKQYTLMRVGETMQYFLLSIQNETYNLLGLLFSLGFELLNLQLILWRRLYYTQISQQLNTSCIILNLVMIVYCLNFITKNEAPNIILMFVLIPLSTKLGYFLSNCVDNYAIDQISYSIRYQHILRKDFTNLLRLEHFLRLLNLNSNCYYCSYVYQPVSLLIENSYINHLENCKLGSECFCYKEQEKGSEEEDRLSYLSGDRKYEMVKQLTHSILKFHRQESPTDFNDFQICHYKYILDVLQIQSLSVSELFKLKQNIIKKLSWVQKQIIHKMIDKSINQLRNFNRKSTTEIQSQQKESKQFQSKKVNLMSVIHFDEQLAHAHILLLNCQYQKRQFLSILNSDVINLDNLEEFGKTFIKDRDNLYKELQSLVGINSASNQLQKICMFFDQTLHINEYFEKRIQIQRQFNCLSYIPYYDNDSSVVYVSLISKLGQIVKVSKNFEKVVPILSNKDSIGQHISFMQPDQIVPFHNAILSNMKTRQFINPTPTNLPVIIGKDRNNWAIAYEMKIQPTLIGNEDFGVCALMKQIKDQALYVLASSDQDHKSYIMSEMLYEEIFSQCFIQNSLQNIRFSSVIPLLHGLCTNDMENEYFSTILIKPQHREQATKPLKIYTNYFLFQDLMNQQLYEINAKFVNIKNQHLSILQLMIFSCDPVVLLEEKREILKQFKKDLFKYYKINQYDEIDIDNIYPETTAMSKDGENDGYLHSEKLIQLTIIKKGLNIRTYKSKFQQIVKKNKYKIKQMYDNLCLENEQMQQHQNDISDSFFNRPLFDSDITVLKLNDSTPKKKNSIQEKKFSISEKKSSICASEQKKDSVIEHEMSNLSTIQNSNFLKSSNNNLMSSRTNQSQQKKNSVLKKNNYWDKFFNGIESLLYKKYQDEHLKYVNKKMQQKYAPTNKETVQKTSYIEDENENEGDNDLSQDVSNILNLNQEQGAIAEGSVNNSVGKKQSQKNSIVKQITSTKKIPLIFYSGYILDLFLFVLIIASVIINFNQEQGFTSLYQENESLYTNLMGAQSLIFNIDEEKIILDGLSQNYFQTGSDTDHQQFIEEIEERKKNNYLLYKQFVSTLFSKYSNDQVLQTVLDSEVDYSAYNYFDSQLETQVISSLLYVELNRLIPLMSFFQLQNGPNDPLNEVEYRVNLKLATDLISTIIDQMSKDESTRYSFQIQNSLLFIYFYFGFLFIYNVSIITFYSKSISIKQSVLSLFATIQLQKLDLMIQKTTVLINYIEDIKQKCKILQVQNQDEESFASIMSKQVNKAAIKRKNISTTTYNTKFTFLKLTFAFFLTGLIILKPTLSYYFINTTVNSMNIDGSLKRNGEKLISIFSQFSQEKYAYSYFLLSTGLTYNYNQLEQQQLLTDAYNNMESVINDFMTSYQSFSDQSNLSSLGQSILSIINKDICSVLSQYASILPQYNSTDTQQCENQYQTTDSSGFYISSKKFINVQLLYLEYFNNNLTSKQQSVYYNDIFKFYSLEDQYYQLKILQEISQIITYQINSNQQNIFDELNMIMIVITVTQIILIILIFYFVQKFLFKKILEEYFVAKKLLTLIDFNILTENPYIVSYLKQSK